MPIKTDKKQGASPTGKPVKPKFLKGEADAFWDRIVNAYDGGAFGVEDTPIIVLACHAWEQYRYCYNALSDGNQGDPKIATLVCKWFDRLYKLLVALGLTPCQRKQLNVPSTYETLGSVERRPGGDQGMASIADMDDSDDAD